MVARPEGRRPPHIHAGNGSQPLQDRLLWFYVAYARAILTKEWVRILVFSGLSDGYVPDQYMALLKERLFPPHLAGTAP